MIFAAGGAGWLTLVRVLGVTLAMLGLAICIRLATVSRDEARSSRLVKLGFVALPAFALYKLLALAGLIALPAATVGVAGYHLMDGIKETHSCMQCHVMRPMGNDMLDRNSGSLAARHYRNGWIAEQQCYHCHTDYGLSGTLEAKAEGFRHLARYTTRTYREPIVMKHTFNNDNCLHCHGGTLKFDAVPSHRTVGEPLGTSAMSCTNCHGPAHPSRERRTPGHGDYGSLMEGTAWD